MRKKVHYRAGGSATVVASITLVQGQDDAVIRCLEQADNLGRFVTDSLRAYVDRFAGLEPGRRFRQRKDGRLVLHAALEFHPMRDSQLIRVIEGAPAEAVEATLVELMRSGSPTPEVCADGSAHAQTEALDTAGLALEL